MVVELFDVLALNAELVEVLALRQAQGPFVGRGLPFGRLRDRRGYGKCGW